MTALSPAKLYPGDFPRLGGTWYRLARLDDGALILEARSDRAASWSHCADVPDEVRTALVDESPDCVARVLTEAVSRFREAP